MIETTTLPAVRRARRRGPVRGGIRPTHLPPRDLRGMPKPVAAAVDAAWDLFDRREAARERFEQAAAEAREAPDFDKLHERAAVAAGEPMPTPVTPDKQAAEAEARRELDALEGLLDEATWGLYDVVLEHREAWHARAAADVEKARARSVELLGELRDVYRTVEPLDDLVRLLVDFNGDPRGCDLSIQRRTDASKLDKHEEKAVADLRNRTARQNAPIPREPAYLFAALRLLVEEDAHAHQRRTAGW